MNSYNYLEITIPNPAMSTIFTVISVSPGCLDRLVLINNTTFWNKCSYKNFDKQFLALIA